MSAMAEYAAEKCEGCSNPNMGCYCGEYYDENIDREDLG
jgi:hypothetical protein